MFHFKWVIMQKWLKVSAHLGYSTSYSHFQPYLCGFRNEIAIINSETTLFYLRRACHFIASILNSKGHLLFVNTQNEYNPIIQQTARQTHHSYINYKWIGGLLTNWNHMQKVQQHFLRLSSLHFAHHPKNEPTTLRNARSCVKDYEQLSISYASELDIAFSSFPRFSQMKKCFEGIQTTTLPDCLILFNPNENYHAICEANKLQIPIISLVDSTISHRLHSMITYPIPTNENSLQLIYLLCNCILKTIILSQQKKP